MHDDDGGNGYGDGNEDDDFNGDGDDDGGDEWLPSWPSLWLQLVGGDDGGDDGGGDGLPLLLCPISPMFLTLSLGDNWDLVGAASRNHAELLLRVRQDELHLALLKNEQEPQSFP